MKDSLLGKDKESVALIQAALIMKGKLPALTNSGRSNIDGVIGEDTFNAINHWGNANDKTESKKESQTDKTNTAGEVPVGNEKLITAATKITKLSDITSNSIVYHYTAKDGRVFQFNKTSTVVLDITGNKINKAYNRARIRDYLATLEQTKEENIKNIDTFTSWEWKDTNLTKNYTSRGNKYVFYSNGLYNINGGSKIDGTSKVIDKLLQESAHDKSSRAQSINGIPFLKKGQYAEFVSKTNKQSYKFFPDGTYEIRKNGKTDGKFYDTSKDLSGLADLERKETSKDINLDDITDLPGAKEGYTWKAKERYKYSVNNKTYIFDYNGKVSVDKEIKDSKTVVASLLEANREKFTKTITSLDAITPGQGK